MIKTPLWTAIVTPMFEDTSIDYDSFETLLKEQEAARNGILVLGSTGEGLNLLASEKKELVQFAMSLNLAVPVMVGIGGFHLQAQKEFIQYCDGLNADAYLFVAPIYAKPGKEGQYSWFSELLSVTEKPCMIYNVPSRTGKKIDPEVPGMLLKEHKNILGLKESSGSVEDFIAFRDAAPGLDMYCGDDNLIKEFVTEGAVGLVSVASNNWPKQTRKYLELALEGNHNALFSDWVQSADMFFDAPSPVPAKALLANKGWINTDQVRLPLSVKDLKPETEEALLEAERKINAWFEG